MLSRLNHYPRLKRLLSVLLLLAFITPTAMTLCPKPAEASWVWLYDKIEDPRLKRLVEELKDVLQRLWRLLWSFGWWHHPRLFYRALKHLFHVWYEIITELFAILGEYIVELEREISNSFCKDRACNQLGNRGP